MADNYEGQLLALAPRDGTFAPNSLPLHEIVAHSTIAGDPAIEKAMRHLAQHLPFQLGAWPSFTRDVNEHYRVRQELSWIDVVYMERGKASGATGLNFVSAFYEVAKLIAPRFSAEAEPVAGSLDSSANSRIKLWLAQASTIKHMFEINSFFGHQAATNVLMWMCQELVRMRACETMREATQSEATLVHALQLGGIPEQNARDIYRQFLPASPQDTAIGQHAIMVSDAAFNRGDDQAIVGVNAAVIQRQLDAHLHPDELSADALRSYYVEYYLRQMNDGGFAQFVHTSGWDRLITTQVRDGLKAIGASWHHQLFTRSADLVKQLSNDQLHQFLRSPSLADADPIVDKIADILNRYSPQFLAEEETKSLRSYNAAWLRQHYQLTVLSADEIDAELDRRIDAVPDRKKRPSQPALRVQRLMRALCAQVGQQPLERQQVLHSIHSDHDEITDRWYFSTEQGAYYLVDFDDRAVMFEAETDAVITEIDATHDRLNPGVSIDRDLLPHFIELIETDDFSGIESARFDIEPRHLARLIDHYGTLQTWEHKRALIELVQDQRDPRLRPIMLDFLRSPPGTYDAMNFTRAIALCFVVDNYDRVEFYGANAAQLETDIAAALFDHG